MVVQPTIPTIPALGRKKWKNHDFWPAQAKISDTISKASQVWWCTPVISATWEA
jgi:hypothetical protein